MMIEIRQATYNDIPNIMRFIDEHWKKGHILARDRKFFEWQFVDEGQVNVFLAIDEENQKIYGMQGVIIYNRSSTPDISGSIWKTIKSGNPVLGMELEEYVFSSLNVRYSCSAGISNRAMKIYKLLDMIPTTMDHYYRLADKKDYRIAKVVQKVIPVVEKTGYKLQCIQSVDEMKQVISEERLAGHTMSKDYAYIQKRYFEHPVYQYDVWKIVDEKGSSDSILITREEIVQDRKICKMVDFYGELKDLSCITTALDELMEEREYEFVDIYSYGVPTELYDKAGFIRCDEDSENIIPNYFHPFERKNISLHMIDPMIEGLTMFRGDGDQDRPC